MSNTMFILTSGFERHLVNVRIYEANKGAHIYLLYKTYSKLG